MPIIGVTSFPDIETKVHRTNTTYIKAIRDAGGIPLQLPTVSAEEEAREMLAAVDGLLLPGGPDMNPLLLGEEPLQGKPVFGICRGMQLMNTAFGGTLWQDIFAQDQASICHRQGKTMRRERTHTVITEEGSLMRKLLGGEKVPVNSYHHQAVKEAAPGFRATAWAADGIIEAIESEDRRMFGVQWHPEELQAEHREEAELFRYFLDLCRRDHR